MFVVEGYSIVKGWTKVDLARLTWIKRDKIPVLSGDVCEREKLMKRCTERREGQGVVMDRKIPEEIVPIRTIPEGLDEIHPCAVGVLIAIVVEI